MGNKQTKRSALQMKRSEIIKECKKNNLPYHGSKQDMVNRLTKLQKNNDKIKTKSKPQREAPDNSKIRSIRISEHEMDILAKYFLETDNIPWNVKQAFNHVQDRNNENKSRTKKDEDIHKDTVKKPVPVAMKSRIKKTNPPNKVIKYNPFQKQSKPSENTKEYVYQHVDTNNNDNDVTTASWIEWSDLEVLRNIVGCWVMGERGAAYEFMKVELTMNESSGKNRKWRAQIQKGKNYDYGSEITNIYGYGHWRLTYPTSIHFRQNLHHICNYYMGYYKINFMILSRDVINVIADYTLGIGVRSLDLIQMQLILERESFRHTVTMDDNTYTFNGCDERQDFSESFGLSLTNTMVDLLDYCINQVENKEENDLQNYDSFMKLDQFTDDEQDEYFQQYFHNGLQ